MADHGLVGFLAGSTGHESGSPRLTRPSHPCRHFRQRGSHGHRQERLPGRQPALRYRLPGHQSRTIGPLGLRRRRLYRRVPIAPVQLSAPGFPSLVPGPRRSLAPVRHQVGHIRAHRRSYCARRDRRGRRSPALFLRELRYLRHRPAAPRGNPRRPADHALRHRVARGRPPAGLDQHHHPAGGQ